MRYVRRRYVKQKTNEYILKKLMVVMFIGSILGALFFCIIDSSIIEKISGFIENFLAIQKSNDIKFIHYFETILKGIKYLLFIWFLAYIPLGDTFIYIIVFAKGFFISFTTSAFFYKYGIKGIVYIFNTYILQNIVIIFLIFYISYVGIDYYKNSRYIEIKNYIRKLVIVLAIYLILSLII